MARRAGLAFFLTLTLTGLPCLTFAASSPETSKVITSQGTTTQPAKSGSVLLKPYTAELKASMKGLPISGSGNRELKQNKEGHWELNFDASSGLFGISESSEFSLSDGTIKPEAYRYKRSGIIGSKPEEKALFDWKQSQVNWENDEKHWAIKLQTGALDNLSYQTQLRMDLAAGKKELNYLIADDDEVYLRSFVIEGEEVLSTDAGKLNTVRVRIKRDNNKRETWIWFAKDWDFFFVKLLQKEGGSEYTVELKNASIDGKPIKGI
ncbi:DUF3108 domain-containing protein [Endozoicomonas sp. Mp262]|uniref:DUF3108 domain-containing protein n=1 Tax=Endozoicomonas sp. Mp262 TaxID=2919499 RepID=UPI0021D930B2